jgi:xanthine dehydrogenase molybdopterin-binding subunit B
MTTQARLKVITDFNGYEFSATPGDAPQQDETPQQVIAKYNALMASPAVLEQQARAQEALRFAALERNEAAEKAVTALIGTESRSKEELFAALAKIKSALGSEDIDFFVMTSLRHPAEIEMFTQEYLNRTGAIGLKNLRLVACANETLMGTKRFWLEAADKYEQSLSSAS